MISDQKRVVCYLLDDGELTELEDLFSLHVNQVLLEVMNTEIRNENYIMIPFFIMCEINPLSSCFVSKRTGSILGMPPPKELTKNTPVCILNFSI